MLKIKYCKLISSVVLMGILFWGLSTGSQPFQFTVQLTTDPPIGQLFPFEAEAQSSQSPTRITLQAIDSAGQKLKNTEIRVQVFAPATTWLSTDFPIVEGTKLLELQATAATGTLQFQQMLPIRGNYQLQVDVTPVNSGQFESFQQTLTLPVQESGVKYRNFGILALVLLSVGLGGGWVIGGSQSIRPGDIAPERVRLLLSGAAIVAVLALLTVNLSALFTGSHSDEHSSPVPASALQAAQGLRLELVDDTEAIVGQPATLTAQITESATGRSIPDVPLSVKVTQLEDGWIALAYQGISNADGKLTWQEQFFDGAPHQIEVAVLPQLQTSKSLPPVQVSQTIEVEGVAPPLTTRLISLFYLMVILWIGLGLGLWLRKYPLRANVRTS